MEIISGALAAAGWLVGHKAILSASDTSRARVLGPHDLAALHRVSVPVKPNNQEVRVVISCEALKGVFSDSKKLVSLRRKSRLGSLVGEKLLFKTMSEKSPQKDGEEPSTPKTPKTPRTPKTPKTPKTPVTPKTPKGVTWNNVGYNTPGKPLYGRRESESFLEPEKGVVVVRLGSREEFDLFVNVTGSVLGCEDELSHQTFFKLVKALNANGIGDIYSSSKEYIDCHFARVLDLSGDDPALEGAEIDKQVISALPRGFEVCRKRRDSEASLDEEVGITACCVEFVDGFGIPVAVRVVTGEVDQTTALGTHVTMVFDKHGTFLRLSQSGGYMDEKGQALRSRRLTI